MSYYMKKSVVGTIFYMAPEACNKNYTNKIDVFR